MSGFEIEVWGARGSVAASHSDLMRAGCNTTCVSVRIDGHVIILDAGTGLVPLGHHIQQEQVQNLSLFLTHYHYDHVQGLNFFTPFNTGSTNVTIHAGTVHTPEPPEVVLDRLFDDPFCPNRLSCYPANIGFSSFTDRQEIALPANATLTPYVLNHPSGAYGFRIQHRGRIFVFAPDFEIGDPAGDAALADLLRDADLAFLDAMFTTQELEKRRGFGHSEWQQVAQHCDAARVKSWQMFHHAPNRSDDQLDTMEATLRETHPACGAAREGDRYAL
ncbi:Phosphoribosyl 1,2-cyclic phosphodiesterase [Monaibacterium marinum]|uniref:Phosphoribosyl 1,2-cyclic phosphodiesterase n=1 Tax=Pontivivens marinum TaxID=1690039 RepID=A0A2C9CP30_9RHOB|nr:MBL fold metallo-hydrolase [Monaibacterium marinum]SOH93281.1 Phosphoribosyl 1,2-cyclic phosphodiesterase [Monaibacterium marinum]